MYLHERGERVSGLPPKEFTKLSIHCHFGNKGDSKDADRLLDFPLEKPINYDMNNAIEQINEAQLQGYRLLAHTNSNTLNLPYYILLRNYARTCDIELLPGAEFNIQNWNNQNLFLHVVVIFDPFSNLFAIDNAISEALVKNQKNYLTIEQFSRMLTLGRAIVSVHGIKQKRDKHSLSTNVEFLPELSGLNFFLPVAIEDNESYHRETLELELKKHFEDERYFHWIEEAAAISCTDRKDFLSIKSPTIMWGANTFPDLYHSVLMGQSRLKREVDAITKANYISKIVINGNGGMEYCAVDCSHGLNALIGPSGSGKTLLLDLIKRKLTGSPLVHRSISKSADYSEICDPTQVRFFDIDGNEITDTSGYNVVEGENLYQLILDMHIENRSELIRRLGIETDAAKFSQIILNFQDDANKYLNNRRTLNKNSKEFDALKAQLESAERFISANNDVSSSHIDYVVDPQLEDQIVKIGEELEGIDADLNNSTNHFDNLLEIAKRQKLSEKLVDDIESLRQQFLKELNDRRDSLKKEQEVKNFTLAYKKLIQRAAQEFTKSMGEKGAKVATAKQTMADAYIKLANNVLSTAQLNFEKRVPTLSKKELSCSVEFIDESSPGRLKIKSVNAVIEKEAFPEVFPTSVSARKTDSKIGTRAFKASSFDLSKSDDVKALLQTFIDEGFEGDIFLGISPERILDYEIQLKIDENYQSIESLSAGTLGKIYVEHFFDRAIAEGGSNTIILYDQPESNMEKEFVFRSIVNKFDELRNHHQIFIATHEPLLVVNADANQIIKASNDKKVGTPNTRISYKNCSFVGTRGKEEMVLEVARLIDGHENAVAKRSNIYHGLGIIEAEKN